MCMVIFPIRVYLQPRSQGVFSPLRQAGDKLKKRWERDNSFEQEI